jgi:type I restriction enzyme S subunit
MKDSGVEWIGEIPEDWEVSYVKHHMKWKSEKGQPNLMVLSLYRDYGIIPKDSRDDNHNVTSLDTSSYKVVSVGDFVINKMKAWQGSMAVSDYQGIVSPAYHVCEITDKTINKKYLHYLLRNSSYIPEYLRLSTGMRVGQWDLGFEDFKNIPVILPPVDEQARIVECIDCKYVAIGAVMEKTKASIEEYKKLKQAVITQAVTKGVRGERPMKDSGNEWIGIIPKDWNVIKFGKCVSIKSNLVNPEEYMEYWQIAPDNIAKGSAKLLDNVKTVADSGVISWNHLFFKGQIIYSKIRPLLNKVIIAPYDGLCSADMYPMETKYNTKYVVYLILSSMFTAQVGLVTANRVKMPKINQNELNNIIVPIPSMEEQKEIADYLDEKCTAIDTLISKKEQFLTELENYKKSLIYEYVTGKKEVPQS